MAASISASRFAVLNIEDSDDETKKKSKTVVDNQKKKKSKKKPKSTDQSNLRSLAFGSGKSTHTKTNGKAPLAASSQQLEEWQEHDREIVDDMYEQQLQQALLASKIAHEKEKSEVISQDAGDSIAEDLSAGCHDDKKKRKKSKKKTISIAEFQRENASKEEENLGNHAFDQAKTPVSDENFFEAVDNSAAQLIKKDKMQDEYSKQFKVQAVLNAKHNAALEERDQIIADLRNKLLESQVELQQVKKRNKQLCCILAQGEMKDKSDILQQVDSLTSIKDELTAQLSALSTEIEKERSKVHSLQNELAKAKAKGK